MRMTWPTRPSVRWGILLIGMGVGGCAETVPPLGVTPESVLASDDSVFTHEELDPIDLDPGILGPYDMVGRAGRLFFSEGQIWLIDRAGDPFLHLIAATSGEHLQAWGRSGEGPGDFSNVWQVAIRPARPTEG